jgi:hypothetical protein
MTDQVMLHVMLSSDEWATIEAYRMRAGKRSRRDAARQFLTIGLAAAEEKGPVPDSRSADR